MVWLVLRPLVSFTLEIEEGGPGLDDGDQPCDDASCCSELSREPSLCPGRNLPQEVCCFPSKEVCRGVGFPCIWWESPKLLKLDLLEGRVALDLVESDWGGSPQQGSSKMQPKVPIWLLAKASSRSLAKVRYTIYNIGGIDEATGFVMACTGGSPDGCPKFSSGNCLSTWGPPKFSFDQEALVIGDPTVACSVEACQLPPLGPKGPIGTHSDELVVLEVDVLKELAIVD